MSHCITPAEVIKDKYRPRKTQNSCIIFNFIFIDVFFFAIIYMHLSQPYYPYSIDNYIFYFI